MDVMNAADEVLEVDHGDPVIYKKGGGRANPVAFEADGDFETG